MLVLPGGFLKGTVPTVLFNVFSGKNLDPVDLSLGIPPAKRPPSAGGAPPPPPPLPLGEDDWPDDDPPELGEDVEGDGLSVKMKKGND